MLSDHRGTARSTQGAAYPSADKADGLIGDRGSRRLRLPSVAPGLREGFDLSLLADRPPRSGCHEG